MKTTPQIKLNGWWWKQFIPKQRRLRSVMQDMLDYEYKHGMEERVLEAIKNKMIYGI